MSTIDAGSAKSPSWKEYEKNMGVSLHSLCSYFAMFPPSIPHYFIERYSELGDIVLDPFSGRGTTPLQACIDGRIGVGSDLNPLAYVLTKAKVRVPRYGWIERRLASLEAEYYESHKEYSLREPDWRIRMLYHPFTLRQLSFLKPRLIWKESDVDAFIAASLLGAAHGKSSGYLSLSMPNTFSMSPKYIQRFVNEHHLKRPKRDVFEILRSRVERFHVKLPCRGKAYRQDARDLRWIPDGSVKLIVTSPPYTRTVKYGTYNWIRLWLLGEDEKEIDSKLFCSSSIPRYLCFIEDALKEMWRVLQPDGHVVLVIGDVRDRRTDEVVNLADAVLKDHALPIGFELAEYYVDTIDDSQKVSRIWGKTKGRATNLERILVLSKTDADS